MAQEKKKFVYEWAARPSLVRRDGRKLIFCVVGSRPEAIKMAPVIKALKHQHDYYDVRVVLTGQHPQAETILNDDFDIRADQDLGVLRAGQSLDELMGKTLIGAEALHRYSEKTGGTPDMVLVQGDTTSAFTYAMSAFHKKIPVGHIEAGLRSHNRLDPWPEEMNRRLIGTLADIHFAPTRAAQRNLLREGVQPGRIALTGNTIVDALDRMMAINHRAARVVPDGVPQDGRRLLVATLHRRESWGSEMQAICRALRELVDRFDDTRLVVPLHPNPTVVETVTRLLGDHDRIHPIPALPYGAFIRLLSQSHLILTDSGGIQEEAPTLRVPALVMRDTTERAEATAARQVKLVGRNPDAILAVASALLNDGAAHGAMRTGPNPFGDGQAAARILLAMRRYFEGEAELLRDEEAFEPGRHKIDRRDPIFSAEYYRRLIAPEAEVGPVPAACDTAANLSDIRRYLADYHTSMAS